MKYKNTRYIELTMGKRTLVDDENYEELSKVKWRYSSGRLSGGYAIRTDTINGVRKNVRLHRVLLLPPDGFEIDHINRDKLDNRKKNLRVVTRSENQHNTGLRKTNSSKFKGVHRHRNHWEAGITINGKRLYLGIYKTPEEAHKAYLKESNKYYGYLLTDRPIKV